MVAALRLLRDQTALTAARADVQRGSVAAEVYDAAVHYARAAGPSAPEPLRERLALLRAGLDARLATGLVAKPVVRRVT